MSCSLFNVKNIVCSIVGSFFGNRSIVQDNLKMNKVVYIVKHSTAVLSVGVEIGARDKSDFFRYSKYWSCEIT
jgi:hypothetical protein